MKRHAILIAAMAAHLAGCDPCNQCDQDRRGFQRTIWVARFPANNPVLAFDVGRALAQDCLGGVLATGKDPCAWIYANSDQEAACIRKVLANEAQDGKLQFDDRGPDIFHRNRDQSTTQNASKPAP